MYIFIHIGPRHYYSYINKEAVAAALRMHGAYGLDLLNRQVNTANIRCECYSKHFYYSYILLLFYLNTLLEEL